MIFSLAAFVVAGTTARAQDLTIVSKATTDGRSETTTSYLSRDHVRLAQGADKELIVDFKAARMATLDVAKKTYYLTTRQDIDKMVATLKERMNSPEMKRAREQMDKMSAQDRKQMEAAMGGMFAFDVQKVGTTQTIAGYRCEDWKITMGQFSQTEECLSSELKFPAEAWDMYREFAESLKGLMTAFGPMNDGLQKMTEKFKTLRGYPLATRTSIKVMGHSSVTSSEVTEVKRGSIPASTWEIPAGYKKVENPMQKELGPARRGSS